MNSELDWLKRVRKLLVGRTIKSVSLLDDNEMAEMGWNNNAFVIELDNGLIFWPMQDDEGNGPGALATNDDDCPIIPVMRP